MVGEGLASYRDRLRVELERAVAADGSSHDIAASFAVGSFITMLPTLGTGVAVLAAIVALSNRANAPALFASVVVFNPFVKWGVYAGSFSLGSLMLGPVPSVNAADISLAAGPEVLTRLLVGNLLLATVVAVVGYVLVGRFADQWCRRDAEFDGPTSRSASR